MISDEREFARKITGYLDDGAANLRAGTAYRLQQARARALASLTAPVAEAQLAYGLVGAGGTGAGRGSLRRGRWFGLGLVLLAGAFYFGYHEWHVYRNAREIADIDVQILTSDLPIDAYVDRGFRTWLTSDER